LNGALADCLRAAKENVVQDNAIDFLRARIHLALGQYGEAMKDLCQLFSAITFPHVLYSLIIVLGNCPLFLLIALIGENRTPPPVAR